MSELSPSDIDHFIEHGFVLLRDCIDPQVRREWVARSWIRNGYDPADRSTWTENRIHMPAHEYKPMDVVAPRLARASEELLGGRERIMGEQRAHDGFIVNFGVDRDRGWAPPSPEAGGWHKDGDWFVHFLDSGEQGLLVIMLWDDVDHLGGPTYIACDSIGVVSRFLADHPEGVHPFEGPGFGFEELITRCSDFREATGKAGDCYLLHPFMMHAGSCNRLEKARFITNNNVRLRDPLQFDRPDANEHSPVERGVLRGLGVDSFPFRITGERRGVVPERERLQAELRAAELKRLGLQRGDPAQLNSSSTRSDGRATTTRPSMRTIGRCISTGWSCSTCSQPRSSRASSSDRPSSAKRASPWRTRSFACRPPCRHSSASSSTDGGVVR